MHPAGCWILYNRISPNHICSGSLVSGLPPWNSPTHIFHWCSRITGPSIGQEHASADPL